MASGRLQPDSPGGPAAADPYEVGQRVLDALEKGRRRANELQRARAAPTERAVRTALDLDILAGHRPWGRNTRIAAAVGITPQGVGKILKRLFYRFDSIRPTTASSDDRG